MTSPTPSLQAPVVDPSTGRATPAWGRFLSSIGSGAKPDPAIHVTGASPIAFTAPGAGVLAIMGGGVTAITLMRGRAAVPLPASTAVVPVGNADTVQVSFTGAPAITFLPS